MSAATLIPNRLLKTTPAEVELINSDPLAYRVFVDEELGKVSNPETGFRYFLENYGIHQPADGGEPEALQMWDYQPLMGEQMARGEDVVCLKSRRIGFTLIVCHYLVWTAGLRADTPGARCIAISKNQRDADELISTCRLIVDSLPEYLRPATGMEGKNSQGRAGKETQSYFNFPTRAGASIRSLPSSSSAARGYTATLLFIDELAFHQDAQEVWVAAKPITEGGGQVIIGSTGNGRYGNGGYFATLWDKAEKEGAMLPIFIAWHDRKDRDAGWYEQTAKTMPEDKMRQEYPATPDEAFAGDSEDLAFSATAISAAEKLGREYDQMLADGSLPDPDGGAIEIGIDWGLNSASVTVYPLAGFGFYIADELVSNSDDAETFSGRAIELAGKYGKLDRAFYDAAGAQQMKSFRRIAPPSIRVTGIPFGKYKTRSLEFLRLLLKRTKAEEDLAFIAISPRCHETLGQLREIRQKNDGSLEKGNDHSVDALLAALATAAVNYDQQLGQG
jgi:hypothetical protein